MSGIRVTSAAAGAAHTMFLSDTGLLFGCGLDSSGQVGPHSPGPGVSDPQRAKVDKHAGLDKYSRCLLLTIVQSPQSCMNY